MAFRDHERMVDENIPQKNGRSVHLEQTRKQARLTSEVSEFLRTVSKGQYAKVSRLGPSRGKNKQGRAGRTSKGSRGLQGRPRRRRTGTMDRAVRADIKKRGRFVACFGEAIG